MQQVSIKQAFWDYNFTERALRQKLIQGSRQEKVWIIGRIIENLPYEVIWQYITLAELKRVFPLLRIRPKLKEIWGYTLALWEKHEKPAH